MPIRTPRTPLYAAFFCAVIMAGCSSDNSAANSAVGHCPAPTMAIAHIQGESPVSDKVGQQVTVTGIVTLVQDNHGLYLEEPDSDKNKRTSNAIFVQSTRLSDDITPGASVSLRGTVSELDMGRHPLTALTAVSDITLCSFDNPLPLTDASLPLNGLDREALEGMRIQIDEPLVVTDVYGFKGGNFTLAGKGLQYIPTEVVAPGKAAADLSAKNRAFALPAHLPEDMVFPRMLMNGATLDDITGVLTHDDRGMRISLQSLSTFSDTVFEPPAAASDGALRVVGMNLHNYFNGDGRGGGFPTPRGAETEAGFRAQRGRIGAAIGVLDPHVIAVMELENDGFGRQSAAADFIRLADDSTGHTWAVARPAHDNTGDDAITVGIFYRTDHLVPVDAARTLSGAEFKRSRQPMAQLFKQVSDGEKLLVVVNHLKSKGSCPDSGVDANQRDGQGCWNPMRTASARKMSAWVNNIASAVGSSNILVLGDMNAYRNEDPIKAIRKAGFTELMDDRQGETSSFVFYGQHGTLDYAFSSKDLLEQIDNAFIWRVNTILPRNMDLPQPWLGFSDHDPVVVDIRSRHSKTSD